MEKSTQKAPERESSLMQQLFFKYLPYWPLFLTLFVLSIAGLAAYLKVTTPVYEVTASILIKDETKGQEESRIEEDLNLFRTNKTVENETQILASNEIVGAVVRKMLLYAPVSVESGWRGKKIVSGYFSSPIVVSVQNPDMIRKTTDPIYFTTEAKTGEVIIDGKKYALNTWHETAWGILKFDKNPLYKASEAIEDGKLFFTLVEMKEALQNMGRALVVTPVSRQSSVINLKLRDEVPQRGELFLNMLVDTYNAAAIERKNGLAMKTLGFIETRLAEVGGQLDSLEGSIQRYRDRSGIVDLTEQGRLYLQSIQDNDRSINNMNMQLSALTEVEQYVQSKDNSGSLVPSTVNVTDPTLSQLVTKLATAQTQYETLKRTTAENNPILKSLEDEISKTKPAILENVQNQKKSIVAGKSYLDQTNRKYSSMLSTVPQKERELIEVSRQQNIKSEIYKFLLQKREETAYSLGSTLPECFMVDQPKASVFPVSPKKPLLALFAGIIPIILGILFVSIKDSMNNKIMYRKEVESLTRFPILGELLYEKSETPFVTHKSTRSFIQEQFRQIRSGLKYQGTPKGNIKRILVTSSIKGEGKSFVSSNLAISLAKNGRKVCLVELDLHHPKLTERFGYEMTDGVMDYLSGKIPAEGIAFQTETNPNLSLVTAGHPVDDPSELLQNGKIETLLAYLETKFDIVLIDTAPYLALTDAATLAPLVNLVLYIVRHNHTLKTHLEMLDENMQAIEVQNLAIIFNGIKKRGFGRYSYGYGYGYGYDSKTSYDAYTKKSQVA
jgi:capsular exopolysaccharide synthesis family protein